MQERRKFPRIKLITKVTHLDGDFFHYYYSFDLSVGGMFLETREPFPEGTSLRLEFPLPDMTGRVRTEGHVVRTIAPEDAGQDMPSGMGVKFSGLDAQSHALVANFVAGQKD